MAKGLVFLAYLVTKLLGKGFLGNLNKGGGGLIFGLFSRLLILVVLIGLINPWLGIASSWEGGAGSLILKKNGVFLISSPSKSIIFLLTGGRVDGLIFGRKKTPELVVLAENIFKAPGKAAIRFKKKIKYIGF